MFIRLPGLARRTRRAGRARQRDARAGETLNDIDELSLQQDSRFWRLPLVTWWIHGDGRDGHAFRLLPFPPVTVFVLEPRT
ncbi:MULTISPECIES: hypothetical protein [Burkholderia]|uniref:hypothetical protein n=1 Tax=Burkholderia TaxID=32008 RepID=UPI00048134D4|nr:MULTISPECIES: hypothetical protein [Burkholderia]